MCNTVLLDMRLVNGYVIGEWICKLVPGRP